MPDVDQPQSLDEQRARMAGSVRAPETDIPDVPAEETDPGLIQYANEKLQEGGYDSVKEMLEQRNVDSISEMEELDAMEARAAEIEEMEDGPAKIEALKKLEQALMEVDGLSEARQEVTPDVTAVNEAVEDAEVVEKKFDLPKNLQAMRTQELAEAKQLSNRELHQEIDSTLAEMKSLEGEDSTRAEYVAAVLDDLQKEWMGRGYKEPVSAEGLDFDQFKGFGERVKEETAEEQKARLEAEEKAKNLPEKPEPIRMSVVSKEAPELDTPEEIEEEESRLLESDPEKVTLKAFKGVGIMSLEDWINRTDDELKGGEVQQHKQLQERPVFVRDMMALGKARRRHEKLAQVAKETGDDAEYQRQIDLKNQFEDKRQEYKAFLERFEDLIEKGETTKSALEQTRQENREEETPTQAVELGEATIKKSASELIREMRENADATEAETEALELTQRRLETITSETELKALTPEELEELDGYLLELLPGQVELPSEEWMDGEGGSNFGPNAPEYMQVMVALGVSRDRHKEEAAEQKAKGNLAVAILENTKARQMENKRAEFKQRLEKAFPSEQEGANKSAEELIAEMRRSKQEVKRPRKIQKKDMYVPSSRAAEETMPIDDSPDVELSEEKTQDNRTQWIQRPKKKPVERPKVEQGPSPEQIEAQTQQVYEQWNEHFEKNYEISPQGELYIAPDELRNVGWTDQQIEDYKAYANSPEAIGERNKRDIAVLLNGKYINPDGKKLKDHPNIGEARMKFLGSLHNRNVKEGADRLEAERNAAK